MAMDIEKMKDLAEGALDKVSKDKTTKDAVNKVIDKIEEKAKVDLPDVDSIAKGLK